MSCSKSTTRPVLTSLVTGSAKRLYDCSPPGFKPRILLSFAKQSTFDYNLTYFNVRTCLELNPNPYFLNLTLENEKQVNISHEHLRSSLLGICLSVVTNILVRDAGLEPARDYSQWILLTTIVFTTRLLCLWSGLCLHH